MAWLLEKLHMYFSGARQLQEDAMHVLRVEDLKVA